MAFNLDKITAKLSSIPAEFKNKVVQVGVPSGKEYPDGTSVGYVASIHEFGAPEASIPARPFFAPSIQAHSDEWIKVMKMGVINVAQGNGTAYDALDSVGILASKQIKQTISEIHSPELSPITVLLRKWRKDSRKITGKTVGEAAAAINAGEDPGGDDKLLNDTGYLLSQITYAVNNEGSEFTK